MNGKMILKSEIVKGKIPYYYNIVTWEANKDGSVTQTWEMFDEEGNLLELVFKGIFKIQ